MAGFATSQHRSAFFGGVQLGEDDNNVPRDPSKGIAPVGYSRGGLA